MLTKLDIENYNKDGQITSSFKIDPDIITDIRKTMEKLFVDFPELGMDYVHSLIERDKKWLEFAKTPIVLDLVESVIGPDIIVWGSALFCKKGNGGKATPWHQDGQYWPIRPLETVTVWIAIDASTTENGCLRVIPGSHSEKKLYDHGKNESDKVVLNQELDINLLPKSEPRDIELESGMFSVHDVYLAHGAEPNNSGKRRGGLTFRYMPSSSHFDRQLAKQQSKDLGVPDISERELHLVRGINRHSGNDSVI